jgi:energy-coupling factor transport system permease protein
MSRTIVEAPPGVFVPARARVTLVRFHPAAWLAWMASALLLVQGLSQPVLLGVALAALSFVAATLGADGGPSALMLKVGLIALAIRVVLFGLTGHPGGTPLMTLPLVKLPPLLGGYTLGGRVTAEVLSWSAIEGLRLAAVLVCFGTFLSVVEVARTIRMVPRFLFEAGLVVAIGVSFVPWLVRAARDVRDAQRMRGYRARGLRAATSLAMPVLATTLDRAFAVAESMEARGYGRVRGGAHVAEARARLAAFGSVALLSVGVVAHLFRWGPAAVGWMVIGLGLVAMIAAMRLLSGLAARTTYRRDRLRRADVTLVVTSALLGLAALAAYSLAPDSLTYTPYPTIAAPATHVWSVLVVACLAAPVAVAAAQAARLNASEGSR